MSEYSTFASINVTSLITYTKIRANARNKIQASEKNRQQYESKIQNRESTNEKVESEEEKAEEDKERIVTLSEINAHVTPPRYIRRVAAGSCGFKVVIF